MPAIHCLIVALLIFSGLQAQKVRSEEVVYHYTKLPLLPLDKSIKNYSAKIEAPYEAKNKELLAAYEQEKKKAEQLYNEEMKRYPQLVKEAEDQYQKDLDAYNKKSLATRVVETNILKENNKPVKQIPSKPYLATIPPPALKTTYDLPVLANTWIRLGGYQQNNEQAVQVIVTIYGFDHTEPRTLSNQKDMVSISKGTTTRYKANYYHTEFSYRHPMSVKVILPGGKEVLNVTPQQLNTYKIYKTQETETVQSINRELLIKTHEEKILQENLAYINQLVNDQFGFGKTEQKARIYYVKEKGDEYQDLTRAFNEVSSGLHLLYEQPEAAKAKIETAISLWKDALKESDPSNKKVRIDKEVTQVIFFNLMEACFAIGDVKQGFEIIEKVNGLGLSASERKIKEAFESAFSDLKKRKTSNQII